MAKKKQEPKAKTRAPAAAASPATNKTLVMITERQLKSLLGEDDNYKGRIDGLVGELRETIGNAVEKKHLHKGAYALVKKFHRMKSNEQLSDLWHTVLAYMDMAGIMARIDSVSALPLDGDDGAGDDEGAGEGGAEDTPSPTIAEGGEVHRPQFGGRQRAH